MTNEARSVRRHAPKVAALAAALLTGVVACGDDPFSFQWSDQPDTAVLYSMARPELNVPAAYDFYTSTKVVIESPNATGTWDLALDTRDGGLVFLPPGALGVSSRARVAPLEGLTLDDVTDAPGDTAVYTGVDAVPVELGTTYIVRTSQRAGSFGRSCVYYAKMEALEIDVAEGTLRFRHVTNPVCNDRRLVPPN